MSRVGNLQNAVLCSRPAGTVILYAADTNGQSHWAYIAYIEFAQARSHSVDECPWAQYVPALSSAIQCGDCLAAQYIAKMCSNSQNLFALNNKCIACYMFSVL